MKKLAGILVLQVCCFYSSACTTFLLNKNGQLLFGRNYDWVTGAGILYANQRGLFKTSVHSPEDLAISWVSRYASLTFNQYGKEFPTGGMNEAGLVVELMWLDETQYPQKDQRAAINVLQWIQYQLDNCKTTKDVIATNKLIRIKNGDTPLHYFIADADGHAATIEFLDGKMIIHQDENLPFPVLTNSTYQASLETAVSVESNKKPLPSDNSLQRFVTACKMLKEPNLDSLKMPYTDYAFSILKNVAQGDFTKWSIVYDIHKKEILFKTSGNTITRIVKFSAFDFNCVSPAKMYDLEQSHSGDIGLLFIAPDKNIKQRSVEKAVRESKQYVEINDVEKAKLLDYEYSVTCKF